MTKGTVTLVLVMSLISLAVYFVLLHSTYVSHRCWKLSSSNNLIIPNPYFFSSSCVVFQFDSSKIEEGKVNYIRTGFITRFYFSLSSSKIHNDKKKYLMKVERKPEFYGPNNIFGDSRNTENLIYSHLFDTSSLSLWKGLEEGYSLSSFDFMFSLTRPCHVHAVHYLTREDTCYIVFFVKKWKSKSNYHF